MTSFDLLDPYDLGDSFSFLGAHVFASVEAALLLNPATGTTLCLDASLVDRIRARSLSDDLRFKLIQRGFAATEGAPTAEPQVETFTPTFFIINLTAACNLRCEYCFRRPGHRNSLIERRTLQQICSYITSYCERHRIRAFSIQPWGGEPLLAAHFIYEIQDSFRERGQNPIMTVETNATIIDEPTARQLFARRIQIGVSIDGDPSVHDRQRPHHNGTASHAAVVRGIRRLRDAGYGDDIGALAVVTRNTLQNLEQTLDYFARELRLRSVKMNLMRHSEQTRALAVPEAEVGDYVARLMRTLTSFTKEGMAFTEGNTLEKLSNLVLRRDRNICASRGCRGGRSMVSFDGSGNIYPCELTDDAEESIGNIADGRDLTDVIRSAATTGTSRCPAASRPYSLFWPSTSRSSPRAICRRRFLRMPTGCPTPGTSSASWARSPPSA